VCMCQQGGERCRTKNLLCTGLCECINLVSAACEGDMHFRGEFLLSALFWHLLLPRTSCIEHRLCLEELVFWCFFPLLHDCVEPCLFIEEHACFDRLRRAVSLVLGDLSLLVQVTCSCFSLAFCHLIRFSSSFFFFLVPILVFGITDRWC